MTEKSYQYVIIGGGLAAASAVEGIRERDAKGSILLVGREQYLPYDRPPLSKKLWLGGTRVEEIFVQDSAYYTNHGVDLALGTEIVDLDASSKTLVDHLGREYQYQKLLIATGGSPRHLDVPESDLEGIIYYRTLDDYVLARGEADEGIHAVVIGGGFIGCEMAAALNMNQLQVTMIYPDPHLMVHVFPEELGRALQDHYQSRGIRMLSEDRPVAFERSLENVVTVTKKGERAESHLVVVGIGINPGTALAERAGLRVENGIHVNELLQTSNPDIYAAGDNANFPYQALGIHTRIEHWDNALHQGKYAGRNMTGADQPYDHMPYFYSDLFDFGYEAVGEVSSRLDTFADWQKEYDTGVIYYLKDNKVRGVMMCNVWGGVDDARELIREGKTVTPEDLRGAIG